MTGIITSRSTMSKVSLFSRSSASLPFFVSTTVWFASSRIATTIDRWAGSSSANRMRATRQAYPARMAKEPIGGEPMRRASADPRKDPVGVRRSAAAWVVLEMKVRAGTVARASHAADLLPLDDACSGTHVVGRDMRVPPFVAGHVPHDEPETHPASVDDLRDRAVRNRDDRRPIRRRDVVAGMRTT